MCSTSLRGFAQILLCHAACLSKHPANPSGRKTSHNGGMLGAIPALVLFAPRHPWLGYLGEMRWKFMERIL